MKSVYLVWIDETMKIHKIYIGNHDVDFMNTSGEIYTVEKLTKTKMILDTPLISYFLVT